MAHLWSLTPSGQMDAVRGGGQGAHLAEAEGCQGTTLTVAAKRGIPKNSVTRPRKASKRVSLWILWLSPPMAPACFPHPCPQGSVAGYALAADETRTCLWLLQFRKVRTDSHILLWSEEELGLVEVT